ncbi:uncharacterized protein [Parasteatoda tepidariorum]|uniref:uncharacterized protein n=1 Tax=Parasteatoda tepidariorum TaxID=114398 RepID=UPI00077FE3BF|nr:uncharacterized protein LOC107440585 [Parasteatoda tepidariorum]
MDLKLDILLLGLLLIIVNISCVFSIKCYSCNSKIEGEEDCLWIPKNSTKFLIDCPASHNKSCRIQEQWVDFMDNDESEDKFMVRKCAATAYNPDVACLYRTGRLGRISVCFCTGDGCNSAVQATSTVLGTLGFVLLVMLFMQKL